MDPIPETARLLASLDAGNQDRLAATMQRMAQDVARLVPSLVGLSLTLGEHGLTLALVASDDVAHALDGVQDLLGGTYAAGVLDGREDAVADPLSEERWAEHAQSSSTGRVRSTLSFPLDGEVALTGELTLYASDPAAFDGRQDAVRRTLGVQGGPAVTNGDVPFRRLTDARDAAGRLADHDLVERAVGFVAASRKVGVAEARTLLRDAATRAGVDVVLLARTILHGPTGRPAAGAAFCPEAHESDEGGTGSDGELDPERGERGTP
ncbi:ANTAR domain-containing protein [Cellulomonas sp. NS3]|uniref:ANTAR domain-containing protein n=1 Tax=Cellulomonas sp. NS3 TaxID=2973977 RepID=UPI00216288C9|nr:ANTAR domain-containing protein [Cellulomonas sp. NS3]